MLKDEYVYCSSNRRGEYLHDERKLIGILMKVDVVVVVVARH